MKKSANTTNHNAFGKENNSVSFAVPNSFFRLKNDVSALCSPITFLFQEKLPIIYANIRV
ncbi:hypothetical protein EZL74_12750 [Flavobacterium silvisoli]|uniref:Uncharacterized protein n=1 Tax=Flavobacterium silvisoli TaxID=2529433 RepID=A0A4Q9YU66_9FLAO|nr:hypothetical protein [Flavobacterium silvisoli]TBX64813.1 hypothetical protein EZL74_12750 [Flavobacterium silvisoli]